MEDEDEYPYVWYRRTTHAERFGTGCKIVRGAEPPSRTGNYSLSTAVVVEFSDGERFVTNRECLRRR